MTEPAKNEHFLIGSSIFIALVAAQHAVKETLPNKKCFLEFDVNADPIIQHGESDTRDIRIGVTFSSEGVKLRAHIDCHLYRLKKRWSPEWTRITYDSLRRYMITYNPPDEDGFIGVNDPVLLES